MDGPGKPTHDPPKDDRETVVEKGDSNAGSDEEQLTSLPNHSDNLASEHVASREQGNAVAASEQWNNKSYNEIAERNAAPSSPTRSQKEAFEQMRFDLGNHHINELKFDDDNKRRNANKNFFFHQSKSAVELSKLSSSVRWCTDPNSGDDIAHAYLNLAAQKREEDDPTSKGLDEIGGDEYRENMRRRLAAETGGDSNRKDNSFFAEKGGYARKRGSPSHRGRGGSTIRERTSPNGCSPRRQRSLPPSTKRRNSFGAADASIIRPPSPVIDPVRAAQLAEAKAFQAEVTAPKSPRGRGKSFVPRGNFGKHKTISPTTSKPIGKLVPFKTTSKISPAPKPASERPRPLSIAGKIPSASNGGVIRQPVSTKFHKNWLQNAGAVLRKTSSTKPSSSNSSQRQSPAPSFRSESVRQSAHQRAVSNNSRGTDLIVRTASIPEQVPEELFDDLYDISPRARARLPQNDSRSVNQPSLQRDNSASSFGTDLNVTTRSVLEVPPPVPEESEEGPQEYSDLLSLCGSNVLQNSPRRAAQELMELNEFAWVEEPGISQPDFTLAQEHDNEDMAAAGNASQHDDLSGGRFDESSMLIDLSSPQRNSTIQSAPATNLSGGDAVVGGFVMPPSLMDDSFEMDDTISSLKGGMEIESASPVNTINRSRANAATTARPQERRLARSLVGGPGPKLATPPVSFADVDPLSWQQPLLADATSSHDGEQTIDAGPRETSGQGTSRRVVYAIDEMVALRGMTSPELVADVVDHMRMARQRAQAEADQSREAAERAKDYDAYRQWGSPYPYPRGGGPQMPEELTTPVKNTIKNELELARPASNTDAAKQPAAPKKASGGLGDSRWASPMKNAATTISASQAAMKPAGLRKPSGGLADSRWASPPKKPIASADADDYSDDESFASHKSHKRSPAVDLSRGRQHRTGFPARSSVVDENVSPFLPRTDRSRGRFDGADDESPSPPSRRRRELISPLKSPIRSDKALGDETQDSIVATAFVNADRPALANTTNRSRAKSVTIAGFPKRKLAASHFRLADVDPLSLQQTLLADAQMSLIHQQPQPQHGLTRASTASPSRHGITNLSSLKSFQELNNLDQQRQHATHDNCRKLEDQQRQQVQADTSQLEKQLYANAMLFDRRDQQPRLVQPLPSVAFAPRGPLPVLHARRSIALLLDYLSQSQTPILIGGAYVPEVNNPTQVRRAKYVLRGAPWVDSASGRVRASIYLCENNGEYSEEVGTLDGPPADTNGNLWFADLFDAIDNLSPLGPVPLLRGGFLAPSNIQSAGVNSLGQHDRLDPVRTGGHSAIPGAIAHTAYQPAPWPGMAPRLAGSVYEYALNTVENIGKRNFVPAGPMDRSHTLRIANPSPPVPNFVTARSSPERPPRVSRAIPIRHPENVPAAAPQPRPTKSRALERTEISAIISAESAQPRPSLTSTFASGAMMARSQSQSSSTLSVQVAPFVPICTGRPSAAVPIRRQEDVPVQSTRQSRPSSACDAESTAMARSQSQSSQSSSTLSAQSAPFVPAGSRGPSAVITAHAWAQRDLNTSAVVGSNSTDGIHGAMGSPGHQNTNSNRGERRNNRGAKLSAFIREEAPQATAVATPSQVSPSKITPPPAANMAASNVNGSSHGDFVANTTTPANGPQSGAVPQPPPQVSTAQTTPPPADTTLSFVNGLARGDNANDSPSPAPRTPPPRRPEDVPVRHPRGPPTNNNSAANNFAAMSHLPANDLHSQLPTNLQLIMLSQHQRSPQRLLQPVVLPPPPLPMTRSPQRVLQSIILPPPQLQQRSTTRVLAPLSPNRMSFDRPPSRVSDRSALRSPTRSPTRSPLGSPSRSPDRGSPRFI